MWKTILDLKTCLNCRRNNGKIYEMNEIVYPAPQIHPNCRCTIERLAAVLAGNAKNGDLFEKCPGKMIFGGIYQNKNGHLPMTPNRIWYEADINYTFGFRGTDRILFSNDGLIFVTYDHYDTFIEII